MTKLTCHHCHSSGHLVLRRPDDRPDHVICTDCGEETWLTKEQIRDLLGEPLILDDPEAPSPSSARESLLHWWQNLPPGVKRNIQIAGSATRHHPGAPAAMPNPTVDEVRERKKQMEDEIDKAIENFRNQTGICLESVEVEFSEHDILGNPPKSYVVQVRTKLLL